MTSRRSLIRRSALVAAAGATALVLAACSSSSGHDMSSMPSMQSSSTPSASASASAGAHNAQDLAFAQQMITHHRQATAMADLAATGASSSQVKSLATTIKGEQDPEITTMSGWLTSWGTAVPQDMKGMDMSSGMPGMMSTADMTKLDKASGTMFDTMFLQMMVQHHQGAVTMAKTEQSKGEYGPAKTLAASIITAQTAEINQMNALLKK
ncbi:DUF305 domain-containing protein [Actinacidiphila soli]|uniref:DUF305 domain-containing protein n=1 Tax=Actinacidiphila soli TaxID=2487275 RepID=UPI000FCA951E|nr:DUF305 domain-containing protein [Actinacidiphila soli]